MPEEEDVRERDQDDLFQQRVLQRVDGVVDQFAAVIKGTDGDARRQAGRDLRDLLLDVLNDRLGIFAGAHDHGAAHGLVSVQIQRTAPEVAADLHGGHVL